ncbi:MAG: hypothetical protein P0119_08230 [Nitrospira sp.]|nr:hypothetical protein [Nitrospira sp.]
MRGKGIGSGLSAPLVATVYDDGVNFSLYCRSGTFVELLRQGTFMNRFLEVVWTLV